MERSPSSVFKFRETKKKGNNAKLNEKDAKQNSKLARLSETKLTKVRMRQFRFHEPLKTIFFVLRNFETLSSSQSRSRIFLPS
jgi:hypothetical protein